jgi:mannose-6-phosphate isomerase-like protein (cupin superfamily)
MNELSKAQEYAVGGGVAGEIVARIRKQMESWGLVMPAVDPVILDFGLGQFESIGEVEYWIANEVDAGYCGKLLFLFEGQTCPKHMHKTKVETFYIVKGSVRMDHGGRQTVLSAGDTLRVDVGAFHEFSGVGGPALVLEVSMPSVVADNYFENRKIPIGGNHLA